MLPVKKSNTLFPVMDDTLIEAPLVSGISNKKVSLNYKIEFDFNAIDPDEWSAFVKENPHGNIFQTAEFYNFISKIPGFEAVVVAAISEDGSLSGIIVGAIQKENGYLKRKFSSRLIIRGGPLVRSQDSAVTDYLLKSLISRYKNRCIYIEFRNRYSIKDLEEQFLQNNFVYSDYVNFIVDIEKHKQSAQQLNSGKKRQIKKSLENKAVIIENATIEQVRSFYSILKDLYTKKIKKPLPPWEFFEHFFLHPEIGKYFLIEYKGEIVGGIMCPVYDNKIIYEWYIAGQDGKYEGIYPSVLATWAPINYALKKGLLQFDFLGAGKPNEDYGVRKFKSGFGGELVAYGRYIRINNRLLYKIGKTGLGILRMIKK